MILRPAQKDDLSALTQMQNELAPSRRRMPLEVLQDSLFGVMHGSGAQTCVALDGSSIRGVCGWVKGGKGEFFVAPFIAATAEAAGLMAAHVLAAASGSAWMRVSYFPEEEFKRDAFVALGFAREFDFVEFEKRPTAPNAPKLPVGIQETWLPSADPSELRELMNAAFQGVDNSLPLSLEAVQEILVSPFLDTRLSLLWKNAVGRPIAYVITNKDGYLDSIGILPEAQKLGYGALLYKRVLAFAAEKKMARIFTTVSSRNVGSLRLHARLGISEVERRTVLQRSFS